MSSPLHFGVDKDGVIRLRKQLEILALKPDAKKQLVKEMAMEVRRVSRKNIKDQRCVDGTPMAPRKMYKRNRRGKLERRKDARANMKMLVGLSRLISVEASRVGRGEVSWGNTYTAKIADKHQHGKEERFSARNKVSEKASDYYNPKARVERWLAKEILRLGYRSPVKDKMGKVLRLQRVSQKWVVQNMSRGEAMAIWQELSGYEAPDAWTVGVPERPFLGVNARQSKDMLEELAHISLNKLRRKGKV